MGEYAQDPILVAVDFSPDSEAAFLWASQAARAFDAPLVVLHVVHDPEAAPGYYSKQDASGRLVPMEEAAREMFDAFLSKMGEDPRTPDGIRVSSRMTFGLPANRIIEVADEAGARLIVAGSRGRTGLEHLLLGSKAERVVQLSKIPVTIVKRSYLEQ